MPTTSYIRPNNTPVLGTGWSNVGGAGSAHAALADGPTESTPNDATYATNTTLFTRLLLALTSPTSPALPNAGERITSVQIKTRVARTAVDAAGRYRLEVNNVVHPEVEYWELPTAIENRYGAKRTRNPTGGVWSAADIDALRVQIEPAGAAPGIRTHELWVVVEWVEAPVVDVTAPTGTQGTTRPVGAVTFTHIDGQPMTRWEIKVFDAATYTDPTFDPNTSTPAYATGEQLGATLTHTPTKDILNGTYRWYWRAAITTAGSPHWSLWDFTAFTVDLDEPSTPILAATPVPNAGWVELLITSTDNRLQQQDADFENAALGTGHWSGAFGNATGARSTAQAAHGTASMLITVTGAGDGDMFTLYLMRARPGEIWQLQGQLRALTTARTIEAHLLYYDSSGTLIHTDIGFGVADSNANFNAAPSCVSVAPALTEYVRPRFRIKAAGAGEGHYLDKVKIAPLLSTWTRGGLVGRNRLTYNQSSAEIDTSGVSSRNNATVTRSNAIASIEGSWSWRLVANAGGDMAMWTDAATVRAQEGETWTALCQLKAIATPRVCGVGIEFFNALGASLGVTFGATPTDSTSVWTPYTHSAVAPPGTFLASVVPYVVGAAAAEAHHADQLSLSQDPSTIWAPGGTGVEITPTVEYTDAPLTVDDATALWTPVRNSEELTLDQYKTVTVLDRECPQTVRRYRARMLAVEAGVNLASAPSAALTVSLPTDVWHFKCPTRPELDVAGVAVIGPVTRKLGEEAGRFQPLADPGSDEPVYPVVVSGGDSGDEGAYRIIVRGDDEWTELLEPILTVRAILLVVSPYGTQKYVRRYGDITEELGGTPESPRRVIVWSYLQAPRP